MDLNDIIISQDLKKIILFKFIYKIILTHISNHNYNSILKKEVHSMKRRINTIEKGHTSLVRNMSKTGKRLSTSGGKSKATTQGKPYQGKRKCIGAPAHLLSLPSSCQKSSSP